MNYLFKEYKLNNCTNNKNEFIFNKDGADIIYPLDGVETEKYNFIVIDVENTEEHSVCLNLQFWENETSEDCDLFVAVGLLPKAKTTVCVPIEYLNGNTLFGKKRPGILKTVVKGNRLNLKELKAFSITIPKMYKDSLLKIHSVQFTTEEEKSDLDTLSLIDELGQQKNRNWEGKTKSLEEYSENIKKLLKKAENFLEKHEDSYYGIDEVSFNKTGYFRLEKDEQGKDWIVTPDGKGFFSIGVDCVNPNVAGPVDKDGSIKNYLQINLKKVFGPKWYECWKTITKYILLKSGINTIGTWSDLEFAKESRIPYVLILSDYPETEKKIFRDFPDVFSSEYRDNAKTYANQLDKYKNESYLIGYFMSNEPNWAFVDHLNLGYELIRNKEEYYSKDKLIEFIKDKYNSDIGKVSKEWGIEFESFNDIKYIGEFTKVSEKGMNILKEFADIMIEEYIKIPAKALKEVDQNHLNLGIRYAYISDDSLYSGMEYFDIFSINCYEKSPVEAVEEVYQKAKMPIIIGEFHFGAIDKGLPATGIRGVKTQEDRKYAIQRYIEEGATVKCLQGMHYFQLNDQPFLGRFDGENYNIGLIDICMSEYTDVMNGFRETQERIHSIIEGSIAPTKQNIKYIPAIFY